MLPPKKKSISVSRAGLTIKQQRPVGVAADTIRSFSKQPRDHRPWEGRCALLDRESTPLE